MNQGAKHCNPHFDSALDRYARTIDPAGRHERWQEIETILKADVPHIFLVWAPLVVIARASRVHGLESHPNNESFVHGRLSAAQPT